MKASDLFVRALEAEGVEHVFAIPGEENLDLLESLRGSNIKLVITRHEQAAGFMASTYGRLTGKAGVCMSTLGPGATNLVTAAAYAQLGAMPMVMITGQKPIKTSKQGQFQIIDVVDMMRPLTKFTKQVVSGDSIPTRIRESFRLAQEERPGATHLELPEDIAREHSTMPVTEPSATRRPIAEDKAICKAIEAIKGARKPLLLAGAGANRKLTSKMLRQFVEKLGIPVITTQMGKGVVNETGPHFLGNTALSDGDFVHRAIDQADLIINVGHDVVEKPPFFFAPAVPKWFTSTSTPPRWTRSTSHRSKWSATLPTACGSSRSAWIPRNTGASRTSTASAMRCKSTSMKAFRTTASRFARSAWWMKSARSCRKTAS